MGVDNRINTARPYKVYSALLTQVGTNPPSDIELENTIGELTFSYIDIGYYEISGDFTENKTFVVIQNTGDLVGYVTSVLVYENVIQIAVSLNGNGVDEILANTSIEIRVYP